MAIVVEVRPTGKGMGENPEEFEFPEGEEVTIGRSQSNALTLSSPDISARHVKLRVAELTGGQKRISITDLGSSNGTYVEERRLEANVPQVLGATDRIVIGSYLLTVTLRSAEQNVKHDPTPPKPFSTPGVDLNSKPLATERQSASHVQATGGSDKPSSLNQKPTAPKKMSNRDALFEQEITIKRLIHEKLIERLDLRRKDIIGLQEGELRNRTEQVVKQILIDIRWEIPEGLDRETLIRGVLDEALGLGPLEELLADEDCSEVMVNSYRQIYAERGGQLQLTDLRFSSEQAVLSAIERIISPIGRRIDESSPLVDARLKDGSRVNAVIRPLALNGPCITIRKFSKVPLTISDLVRFGSLSQGMADFLKLAIESRLNVVISGGTGSGKTTLLNVISGFVPEDQRIITVEDAAELRLPQDHVISFETRPPNLEGKGAITIRELVRNALRMRPDRIIVGECRGAEALDMLQAMNTGHDGSMTTGHANSPADMVRRLETMVLTAGLDLPIRAVREQIASAVQLIVQQTRFSCGTRKVLAISEVLGLDQDEGTVILQDIFTFKQDGYDVNGKVRGTHRATGYVPKFFRKLQERGLPVDANVFAPGSA